MNDSFSRLAKRRRIVKKASFSSLQSKDRWVLSYADFMTLLFAFFVALYALSEKNLGDENRLKETLNGVFDAVQKSVKPINVGDPIIENSKYTESTVIEPIFTEASIKEEHFSIIYSLLNQMVKREFSGLQKNGDVLVAESANWINLEFTSSLLFEQGNYDLTNEAVALLIFVADVLKKHPSVVLVEGHTDDLGVSSKALVSNWHLSSLRSSSVVDELVYRGVDPKMIAPIGFSSEQPKVVNTNEYTRQQNRRVILKISKRKANNVHDYLFN